MVITMYLIGVRFADPDLKNCRPVIVCKRGAIKQKNNYIRYMDDKWGKNDGRG